MTKTSFCLDLFWIRPSSCPDRIGQADGQVKRTMWSDRQPREGEAPRPRLSRSGAGPGTPGRVPGQAVKASHVIGNGRRLSIERFRYVSRLRFFCRTRAHRTKRMAAYSEQSGTNDDHRIVVIENHRRRREYGVLLAGRVCEANRLRRSCSLMRELGSE